jgi:hypothetical protein
MRDRPDQSLVLAGIFRGWSKFRFNRVDPGIGRQKLAGMAEQFGGTALSQPGAVVGEGSGETLDNELPFYTTKAQMNEGWQKVVWRVRKKQAVSFAPFATL